MESIGFKEWSLVCGALGRGETSLLLRKSGIAEGREGFAFRHTDFFLFPTYFHAQASGTRLKDVSLPTRDDDQIEVRIFAKIEEARLVTEWETVAAITPFHVWSKEVVRERFQYDGGNGIHIAFVRAFRLVPEWRFPDEARYGGCRSWVTLLEPPANSRLDPVLSDEEHASRLGQFRAIVGAAAVSTV